MKVWVYGGNLKEGTISDPLYDGCNTAEQDAILVTLNYRLGPMGFLALNSAGIEGNQGIQDLLLGLKWVQSNIAAFGGNPVRKSPLLLCPGMRSNRDFPGVETSASFRAVVRGRECLYSFVASPGTHAH